MAQGHANFCDDGMNLSDQVVCRYTQLSNMLKMESDITSDLYRTQASDNPMDNSMLVVLDFAHVELIYFFFCMYNKPS